MENVQIRDYVDTDYAQVLKLSTWLQNFLTGLDTYGKRRELVTQEDAEGYLNLSLKDVASMEGKILVAEDEVKIVGFILGVIVKHENDVLHNLTHKQGLQGWIGLFFVDPDYRGKGIGKGLLNSMKKYFAQKGCTSMRLKVAGENHKAIELYQKQGLTFREIEMAVGI
jgi:ribosomal protein S18 acetylase RimI-like enzyme